MLVVDKVNSGYGSNVVVKQASFVANPGSFTCILGANGCGKTTLLKTMLGLIKPFSGTIKLEGTDLHQLKQRDIAKQVAYIPQAHVPPFPFSVKDVILMGRTPYLGRKSAPGENDYQIVEGAMERLGISPYMDKPYTTLSGGQQQLVMIARALAQKTRFLFMDEPTANLDFGNEYRVLEQVYSLVKEDNIGVVMVTHNPDHAFYFADEVVIMKDGEIIRRGKPDEEVDSKTLKDIYNTSVEVVGVDIAEEQSTQVCVPCLGRVGRKTIK